MKTTKIAILSVVLMFSSAAAFAEEKKEAPKIPEFKKVDVNGDKRVDEAEFAAATAAGVKKTFKELDSDKDGKLNRKE